MTPTKERVYRAAIRFDLADNKWKTPSTEDSGKRWRLCVNAERARLVLQRACKADALATKLQATKKRRRT